MLSSLIFCQIYVPTRVYLLFDLLHGLFIKIRPVDDCARLFCDQMSFFGAQCERRIGKRIGIEIIYHRKTVVDYVFCFFFCVHHVVQIHSEFAVVFRRHEMRAKPVCDRLYNARRRRADDKVVGLFLREIPRGNLLFVFIPVEFDLFVEIVDQREISTAI